MDCLHSQSTILIKEQASMIEALTAIIGQEIEMGNKYKIMTQSEEEIFFAVEETDCMTRQLKQCCPDCAPWSLGIAFTQGGANQKVFHMKRDWTCTFCCFNRPVVEVIDVPSGQKLGSISDPFACCDLTFDVRDPGDQTVIKANGGCCQWGLCCPLPCGPCAEVNFEINDAGSGQKVGNLQKKVPNCCKFFFAPDVDNFNVEFGGVSHPQYKALIMALAIFMDFRYFNENSNDDEGGLAGAMAGDGDGDGDGF
jgi:hypothetical protein